MRRRSISGCLLVLGFVLGCGGDDSGNGGMCSDDSSCGGKLEGSSWKLANACYTVLKQPQLPGCTGVTAELSAKTEGSVTFEKDSYDRHMQIDTQLTFNFPKECKEAKGGSCKAFEGMLASSGVTLSCQDAEGGCKCMGEQPSTTNDSGGYTIRGNKVELVGDTYDYCVKDSKLTIKPTQPAQMSGSTATSEVRAIASNLSKGRPRRWFEEETSRSILPLDAGPGCRTSLPCVA